MKKEYKKPEIMFECFSMSTNIAANCDFITSLSSEAQKCAYWSDTFEVKMFQSNNGNCDYVEGATDDYNGICYHVPDANRNLFNS